MFLIQSSEHSPYFNLAAEDYLLRKFDEQFIFLYVNSPSVIVGKHQNTLNEINYHHIKLHDIDVVRRISGGGTVYHDQGNINFCFIKTGVMGKLVDFKKQTAPIIQFLKELGLDAHFKGHNDLRIADYKISGNAEHVFKNRVLHHGTLLFNSDLNALEEAIKLRNIDIQDKAVKSVRASVKNIIEFLNPPINTDEFVNKLSQYFLKSTPELKPYSFTDEDLKAINQLIQEKFSTWDWNYGYSPGYLFNNSFSAGKTSFSLKVKKGSIQEVEIESEIKEIEETFKKLVGKKHKESEITPVLSSLYKKINLNPDEQEEILSSLF